MNASKLREIPSWSTITLQQIDYSSNLFRKKLLRENNHLEGVKQSQIKGELNPPN